MRPLDTDMPHLERHTLGEFQDRFNSFNDGLMRSIEINYERSGARSVAVRIATRDAKETSNDGWVCVRLVVSRVEDFCFADGANTTMVVLSHGIHICWFNGLVGLEFGHFADSPESLSKLKSSTFFVTGHVLEWTIEGY